MKLGKKPISVGEKCNNQFKEKTLVATTCSPSPSDRLKALRYVRNTHDDRDETKKRNRKDYSKLRSGTLPLEK